MSLIHIIIILVLYIVSVYLMTYMHAEPYVVFLVLLHRLDLEHIIYYYIPTGVLVIRCIRIKYNVKFRQPTQKR